MVLPGLAALCVSGGRGLIYGPPFLLFVQLNGTVQWCESVRDYDARADWAI